MSHTRLVSVDDAEELLALSLANADFLAPWEPLAPPEAGTLSFVRAVLNSLVRAHDAGAAVPHMILDGEQIIGRITLSTIVHGAFESCTLGYWVAEAHNGRGHATQAVAEMCALAFGPLGLHRVQAGTLLHNAASQRVLMRNGFVQFGVAPAYLKIAGRWQDHVLFQRLAPDA